MHYNSSSTFALYHALDLRCQGTSQTNNSEQFGIEALYKWRAGPREEAICPRSQGCIWGTAENSTHECWLPESELVTTGLTPSHVHQNKNQEQKTAAGQDSHLPSKAQRVHADNLLYRLEAQRAGQSSLQNASAKTRRINR